MVVVPNLPVDVLLGTDLFDCHDEAMGTSLLRRSFTVLTRRQKRQKEQQESPSNLAEVSTEKNHTDDGNVEPREEGRSDEGSPADAPEGDANPESLAPEQLLDAEEVPAAPPLEEAEETGESGGVSEGEELSDDSEVGLRDQASSSQEKESTLEADSEELAR